MDVKLDTNNLIEYEGVYLMQTDPRWAYEDYGNKDMGITGCGPTSLAMVYMTLTGKTDISPVDIARFSEENGYYIEGVGSSWDLMIEGPNEFGFSSREVPLSRRVLINELDMGNILILSLGPGDFTSSGHFIVVTGYEESGFHVFDSNSWINSSKVWGYTKLQSQIKNVWSFSK